MNREAMSRNRGGIYVALSLFLIAGYGFLRGSTWQGSTQLHTLMEAPTTGLAFVVGIGALLRYYTRKNNTFLFIGTAFLGAALLDGYHAIVSSAFFASLMPSAPASLIPWSWNASRTFLSILMFASWLAWRREERLGRAGRINEKAVYAIAGTLALASFLFFTLVPLPHAYYPELAFGRPEELIAGVFLFLALIGYLRKGAWREDAFEHWIVLSLIVGVIGQAAFMSSSYKLFDTMFDTAHLLKMTSYMCVLTGLFVSTAQLFKRAESSAEALSRLNWSLEMEALERERSERQLKSVLDSAKDAIVTADSRGKILSWNKGAKLMFGHEEEEVLGKPLTLLMPERFRDSHQSGMARLHATGEARVVGKTVELVGLRKDGPEFPIELSLSRWEDEKDSFYTGIIRDITSRKLEQLKVIESEEKFRAISAAAQDGILMMDDEGKISYWNEAASNMFGYSSQEALGKGLHALLTPPRYRDEQEKGMRGFRETGKGAIVGSLREVRALRKDGTEFPVELSVSSVKLNGKWHAVGIIRDVTERAEAHQQLRIQGSALEAAANAIAITNAKGRITWVNPAFTRLTGYSAEEAVGKNLNLLKSGEHDEAFYLNLWKTILSNRIWQGEIVNRRKDGSLYTEEQTITPICDEGGRITHFIAVKEDITRRKEAERQIRSLAFYDSLTKLPNRRLFLERLGGALDLAARHERLVALLFLDLDQFKRVNDTLGHAAGDQLLSRVAERLIANLRASDYVTRSDSGVPPAVISRLGGDEFTVLLTEISDAQDAATVARRILHSLGKSFSLEGHAVFTSASIGIAVYPIDGEDAGILLMHADTAMYGAKERGGNDLQFYRDSMNVDAAREFDLENRLRRAVEQKELSVFYQPVRDTIDGTLVGAEALLRWTDPERGPVSPAEFIPIAEKTGLIVPIGEWVLRTACAQARAWQEEGFRPIRMGVNVSGHQFHRRTLPGVTSGILRDTGLSPAYLELEITERTLLENDEATMSELKRLHEMGIALALDDFGTGQSSLSSLRRFPFDHVKIDHSLVREVTTNRDHASLTTAIIAMAHKLSLKVVAEGVETVEQARFLREHGCDEFQGYLSSPAVSAEEFSRFLEKEKSE